MTSGPQPPGEVRGRRSQLIKLRERTEYPQLTDVPSDLRVNGARHASRESLPPSKPKSPPRERVSCCSFNCSRSEQWRSRGATSTRVAHRVHQGAVEPCRGPPPEARLVRRAAMHRAHLQQRQQRSRPRRAPSDTARANSSHLQRREPFSGSPGSRANCRDNPSFLKHNSIDEVSGMGAIPAFARFGGARLPPFSPA